MAKPFERIAIVGLGGLLPGSTSLESFWTLVQQGRDAGRHVDAGRWFLNPERALDPTGPRPDRVYSTWACPLDPFTPDLTGLAWVPPILEQLDPLFTIGLHAAAMAWRDAGLPQVAPDRAGVILGHIVLPTEATSALGRDRWLRGFEQQLLGTSSSGSDWSRDNGEAAALPAAALRKALGFTGPAYTLDAACASSLYALKLACDELHARRADVMLAGGLSRPDCQYTQMGFAQLQALSRRGRCAPLSAEADGLVVGEGAGLVVLKRLDDAIAAGDKIYATLAGIGISNDRGANLLAPHSEGQLRAMRAAYERAGWQPGDVDLIECHATGTPVGDGVEIESLHTLWQEQSSRPGQCVLGSVKSNVGHLLTAAGGASLLKMIGMLQRQILPPTSNYREPAPGLRREGSPFRVLSEAEPWPARAPGQPRRAAINAFGFGGINAHVLIEEAQERKTASVAVGSSFEPENGSRRDDVVIVGVGAHVGRYHCARALQQRLWSGVAAEAGEWRIDQLQIPVSRFRIPPLELEDMLPQQQLMLDVTGQALDDAGLQGELGERAGVFVGISLDPQTGRFHSRWAIEQLAPAWSQQLGRTLSGNDLSRWTGELKEAFGPPLTANRVMGNLGGIVASRLGREFGVGGPCFTVSSGEQSGLTALHVAVQALQRGELDLAVVGAVEVAMEDRGGEAIAAASNQILADGSLAFVLKRRNDALRDGDRIYAQIQDIAPGRDEPSPRSSKIAEPLQLGAATGLWPVFVATISLYQQTHSATVLGTLEAHPQLWLRNRQDGPRTIEFHRTSEWGEFTARLVEVEQPDSPRLIQERRQPAGERPAALFVLQGPSPQAILQAAAILRNRIASTRSLEFLARQWFHGSREITGRHRAAVLATSLDELAQLLDEIPRSLSFERTEPGSSWSGTRPGRHGHVAYSAEPLGAQGQLAFVFPGSGNHFLGMGRELLTAFPDMLRKQDAENDRLFSQYRPDVVWNGASTEAIGRDHKTMIFGQVALGTAVCDWLATLHVRPQAVIGYSLGESAALFGLRAWRDRDDMLRRMEASTLFGSDLVAPFDAARRAWQIPEGVDVPWLSGVIDRPARDVQTAIERYSRVYLLIINTPSQCVIGGDAMQVRQLVAELQATLLPLATPSTVHCSILNEVAPAYVALHQMETTPPDGIAFYSSGSGEKYGLSRDAAAGAILAQAIDTVDFPRVIKHAYRDGIRLFLEIGPGASCTRMIGDILRSKPHQVWALCPATSEPVTHALRVLAELIAHHVPVDLNSLYGEATSVPTHEPLEDAGRCVVTPVRRAIGQPPSPPTSSMPASDPAPSRPAMPTRPSVVMPAAPESRSLTPPSPRLPAPAAVTLAPPARRQPMSRPFASPTAIPMTRTLPAPTSPTVDPILKAWERWMSENVAAHESFLRFSGEAQSLAARWIVDGVGTTVAAEHEPNATIATPPLPTVSEPLESVEPLVADIPAVVVPRTRTAEPPATPPRSLDYDQCLEFAIGKIGRVLGPMFAEIDQFPTRVRLPDVPLMLVDRILEIEGEPLSLTQGRVVTEKDIGANDWYLDGGRIPTCLAVESGQADLFLSGWLGIDLKTRGLACYRLLDAVVTFHDSLPGPGQTMHYDIRINHFFQQGETYLFRFEFDATVNGRPLLTMRDGCAGFFTQQELSAGQGIVQTTLDRQPRPGIRPSDWSDLVPMTVESYSDDQLTALRQGDLAACFGAAFANLPLHNPMTLPSGRLNLVHRVLKLDPSAGKYGLGQIRAEADIHPDDWFLTCHFCDDQVMPGTLMYECCLHTLRIYLLRMGWIGEAGDVAYEPIPGVKSRLKCRGQVLASTKKVWYEVTLKEIGYGNGRWSMVDGRTSENFTINHQPSTIDHPYAVADALMYADGKPIVEITDMSVRLTGLTREQIEALWRSSSAPEPTRKILFDTDRITAFAIGNPSDAFGDRYRVFDSERKIARLPGPPFQFLDRIVSIENCQPWVLEAGGTIVAEYDVPPDAWYFAAGRSPTMPFAVLLETALQPCGWLAGYLGSALTSETDLSFRNLGGKATQFRPVTPDSGTLTTTVKITRVSQSAGMIIQHFDYDLSCDGEPVYVGNTYFGFFSKESLANQVGIRDAKVYRPSDDEMSRAQSFPVPLDPPFPDDRWCMVRRVDALIPDGGPHGLGYVRGSVDVDPEMWFFKAHFYQDPVWPGSLGLESFLQLLQVFTHKRWGDAACEWHLSLGAQHEWVYRGQVIPRDKTVTVDVVITAVDDASRAVTADGFLTVDGRVIYQMNQFTLLAKPRGGLPWAS